MPDLQTILGDTEHAYTKVTTPSGLEVAYCPEPRHYKVNGVEVPSVTTVLKLLSNEALPWWGQGIGAEGVLELVSRGLLVWREDDGWDT